MEIKADDPRLDQILQDLTNKQQQQFVNLTDELENLKNFVNTLNKPTIENNESNQHNIQTDFERNFQDIKSEISNLQQHLIEQMDEAKTLINNLKLQLDQLLNTQQNQSELPPITQPNIPPKQKLVPYRESLPMIDLLPDIWK